MENVITLKTPTKPQVIYFSDGKKIDISNLLGEYDKILLIIDSRISEYEHSLKIINKINEAKNNIFSEYITINNYTKNTQLMSLLLDVYARVGMTRNSLCIAIGGGSVCDLIGVTSSIYMRGIAYATIPTSYISMVDGIISKVAINHGTTKNLVGAFNSPIWTYIDTTYVINHMDKKRIMHGLVEAWKHAIIENDDSKQIEIYKTIITPSFEYDQLIEIAKWSMNVKAKYVLNDWDDTRGLQKQLSLGHTVANYLEMESPLHHAEAVTYGIVFEALLSHNIGKLPTAKLESILTVFHSFEDEFNNIKNVKALISNYDHSIYLKKDKINTHNVFNFVIPTDSGTVIQEVSLRDITNAINLFSDYKTHIKVVT